MCYIETICCPHCQTEIELEVTTKYDEPDDVEIKPVVRRKISKLRRDLIAKIAGVDKEINRGGNR